MTQHPHIAGAANVNWAPRANSATPLDIRAVMAWRALAALDERMLRDIGLTRTDVQVEVEKRYWER